MTLEWCAARIIEWARRWGLHFKMAKTEAALFTRRWDYKKHLQAKLTAKIQVGNGFIWFIKQAKRWLGALIEAHLTFTEHHNRCMKKARAAEARHRTLTKTNRVVPESVRAVQVACVQVVALYGSELWWDPKEVGRRDDLQLLFNRQARSIMGSLPKTARGTTMREWGLTHVLVILDRRQQWLAARLANACSSTRRELHKDPPSGTPISWVVETEHEHSWTSKVMSSPAPGKEPVIKTTTLEDTSIAQSAAQCWAREKEAKVGAGVWMWFTDGSRSDDGWVGAAAMCKHSNKWRTRHSNRGTGHIEVFDAELWVIGLGLGEMVKGRYKLQEHGVKTVAVFSDWQAAIRRTAHLGEGPGQRLVRGINQSAHALLAYAIATEIHWVQGHSSIPRNEESDRQANLARDASRDMGIERPYTSASNRAWRISERRSAANAMCEADKCSKLFSYRLKGRTGTKRPVPMTSVKLLATRFYLLKCRHAPTGFYLKQFSHQEDNKCWWCGGGGRTVAQTRQHLFRHCSRWRDQQWTLWKAVGKATGYRAGRCKCGQMQTRADLRPVFCRRMWWSDDGLPGRY